MKNLSVNKYEYNLTNNYLKFSWTHNFKDENTKFAFYLKKDSTIIEKFAYTTNKTFTYELKEVGEYNIIAFIKINNKILDYECDVLSYFPTSINIIGPENLLKYAKEKSFEINKSNNNAIIIDCIDIAMEWEKKIFSDNNIDHKLLDELKLYFLKLLEENSKSDMFVIRWNLCGTYKKYYNLYWILEELYDCCRNYKIFIKEFQIIFHAKKAYKNIIEEIYNEKKNDIYIVLQKISKILARKNLDEMYVISSLKNNKLIGEILYEKPQKEDKICFYLLHDGKVIEKTEWIDSRKKEYMLKESGVYVIQAFIKRGTYKVIKYAEPIFFATENLKNEYEEFINSKVNEGDNKILYENIPISISKKPYADICVISSKKQIQGDICTFIPEVDSFVSSKWYTKIYSTANPKIIRNNFKVILSGYIFNNDKFFIGTENIPFDFDNSELLEEKGHYSGIIWNNNSINFTTDLFTFKRWFYFKNQDFYVISNNYHLLLITLKKLDIRLNLDIEKAIVTLSTVDVQILMQNFTRKMDMEGVYQVPADKSLSFTASGWNFKDSKVGKILRNKRAYHEDEYRKMIKEAKTELISFSKVIFKNNHFENTVVDLSGGLDSRMMYGLITNLPINKNYVFINSKDIQGSNDLPIATKINSIYKYPYNNLEEKLEYLKLKDADALNRSYYMGTYFSKSLINNLLKDNNVQQLLGACGEIIARPYISRKYIGTNLEKCKDVEKFVSLLYEDYSPLIKVCSSSTSKNFKKYLSDELLEQPGLSNFESLDRLYLSYRHGYHFDSILTIMGRSHQMPLQSQKMLEIHHMAFVAHSSIRLQLDMIYLINPILLMIEFDSAKDNSDFLDIKDKLINEDNRFFKAYLPISDEMDKWKKAEITRNNRKKILVKPDVSQAEQNAIIYQELLKNFKYLIYLYPVLGDCVGLSLYYCIKNLNENDRKTQYWYNKVTSLLDQSLIFKKKQ